MVLNRPILLTATLVTSLVLAGCNASFPFKPKPAEPQTKPATEATIPVSLPRAKPLKPGEQVAQTESLNTETEQETANEAPTDVWQRIRSGMQLSIPDNPAIERQVKWYASHGKYLQRVQERAAPYLYYIVEEIEKRDMPMELALLPVVESAFQPFAYSHGRAAGLWQFIPSTGKMYGLKQTWWYDGRRDVTASTHAALDYLERMAKHYNGDWELALAAYNAGAGNVNRAIRRNQKKNRPTDYWSLDLPRETEGYVPKLLAISKVIAQAEHFQIDLKPIENQPYFASVDVQSQLDLALAADMAEISIEELYRLNPGFNRWATDPNGPHQLNIPMEKAGLFEQKVAGLDPEKRLKWKRYQIRRGDNLGTIARKNGTTVALLKQVNKIQGTGIRAGKHLLIPVSAKSLDQYALSVEQRNQKLRQKKRNGNRLIHVVSKGDTLWEIARQYGVGHRSLARWNGIAPGDTLRLGQKLVVWKKGSSSEVATLGVDSAIPAQTQSSVRYRVRQGDSLAAIAQRFNVSVADLKRWNTLSGKHIQPGQKIQIYVDVTEQATL
jgi:membrane-bound lytic murein transglycosylase D